MVQAIFAGAIGARFPCVQPMKQAAVFPGQGAQFVGMGKTLYDASAQARAWFDQANEILGFPISEIMCSGSDAELKRTEVTQPAVFLHSVITALVRQEEVRYAMMAGHSLGEFSALVVSGCLRFADGLQLVARRAKAMQQACEAAPSTMAAILGVEDSVVEQVCASIRDEVVVPANYNCPGQLVISGSVRGVQLACELLKQKGAKRAVLLPVGGAFHSPLMEPARQQLEEALLATEFQQPYCPIYQNVTAQAETDPKRIRQNLVAQLTAPVRWTQSVQQMIADGAREFVEIGPGNVLQGLIKKIDHLVSVRSL